ncbi:MAG: class I SAM-dependent methyltransferase [Candidatus Obscuribacterales bacterium]|nr:class I SAM-dependent methyltransferase [Candidatus Obscuribacterales bacterium]
MLTLQEPGIEEYSLAKTQEPDELLGSLMNETYEKMSLPQMLCGPIEGQLLKQIVKIAGAKKVVEVGTFTGFSTLCLAEGLPDDGELFTLDIDPECLSLARSYFAKSKHGKKITVLEGPALESLKSLSGPFDLAFIDADKTNYHNYYEAILPKLKKGGVILVDNVLWGGSVVESNQSDENAVAIRKFNEHIAKDDRVEKVLLTVRDGVYFILKR